MSARGQAFGILILCAGISMACAGLGAQTKAAGAAPSPAAPAEPGTTTAVDGQAVVVRGTLRRVGNEPFSRLVLTDSSGRDWDLDAAARKALSGRETARVRVSAILRLKPRLLANGKRLPDLRELTEVKLLD